MSGDDRTAIISPKVALPLPDIFPHAVKANGMIFVSGSIGMNESGTIVPGGVQEHTVRPESSIISIRARMAPDQLCFSSIKSSRI